MPLDVPRSTRSLLLAVACTWLLASCSGGANPPNQSNPSNPGNPNGGDRRPSPIPIGYAMLAAKQQGKVEYSEGGEIVDELLAVVDGERLTRMEVARRLRLPANPKDGPTEDQEEEINAERLKWAKQQLIISAARRAGLRLPESAMDDIAMNFLKGQMKENEEKTGEVLTPEEYLDQRDLTWREYREQAKGDIIYQYYIRKLLAGIGPTRPEVDMEISPAEVRRIYYDNRKFFDVKPGVRFALFAVPFERFEKEGADLVEAEVKALKLAEDIKGAFERRNEPWVIAGHMKLQKSEWSVSDEDKFVERFRHPDGNAWLFDPARKVGDATIFRDMAGPLVLGVVEMRPARQRRLEEVYDDIRNAVTNGKQMRLEANLIINQLDRGGVVWPDELADELLDEAHELLDFIETHDVLGRVRLR